MIAFPPGGTDAYGHPSHDAERAPVDLEHERWDCGTSHPHCDRGMVTMPDGRSFSCACGGESRPARMARYQAAHDKMVADAASVPALLARIVELEQRERELVQAVDTACDLMHYADNHQRDSHRPDCEVCRRAFNLLAQRTPTWVVNMLHRAAHPSVATPMPNIPKLIDDACAASYWHGESTRIGLPGHERLCANAAGRARNALHAALHVTPETPWEVPPEAPPVKEVP